MKHFDVVSIFPGMFEAITGYGISKRALERGLYDLVVWNPRDYSESISKSVDGRPYGGGPGMVMSAEPLSRAIDAANRRQKDVGVKKKTSVYLSPQGERLDRGLIDKLEQLEGIVLLAGRYEGVDERLIQSKIEREVSIGDYVVSGGELAAMVLIDALVRRIPGAINDRESLLNESFETGFLDYPQYTRPEVFESHRVPPELMSGDHKLIDRWRLKESIGRTWLKRPDLMANINLDAEQFALLDEFKREKGVE